MGTRAQFFIGNPSDLENRKWLGTTAWDGYPSGYAKCLIGCKSEGQFEAEVRELAKERDDFCDPAINDFPFPWTNDLYLTDYTYAFFDGRVQVTCYHCGWRDYTDPKMSGAWKDDADDELPRNVPAPRSEGKSKGPDSIMLIRAI